MEKANRAWRSFQQNRLRKRRPGGRLPPRQQPRYCHAHLGGWSARGEAFIVYTSVGRSRGRDKRICRGGKRSCSGCSQPPGRTTKACQEELPRNSASPPGLALPLLLRTNHAVDVRVPNLLKRSLPVAVRLSACAAIGCAIFRVPQYFR